MKLKICRNLTGEDLFLFSFRGVRPSVTSTNQFLSLTLWFASQQNDRHFNQNINHEHVSYHTHTAQNDLPFFMKWKTKAVETESGNRTR
jgi:hypothetical protein